MRKKVVASILIILILVVSFFYSFVDKNYYIYDRSAESNTFYGTGILNEQKLIQTFVSKENTIDGINIKVAIHGNVDDVKLHCVLLDDAGNEMSKVCIEGNTLDNNKFNLIKIPQIQNAKGKEFVLQLYEENSTEENGFSFWVESSRRREQKLQIGSEEKEGTLVARIICHRFDVETFFVVIGMITFIVGFMKVLYKFFR